MITPTRRTREDITVFFLAGVSKHRGLYPYCCYCVVIAPVFGVVWLRPRTAVDKTVQNRLGVHTG